jgi:hypothetical protein
MDRLSSDEKIEAGEEVECAIDPECPQYLRRSDAGEGAGVVGSAMPNTSVTAYFPRIVHIHKKATTATITADRE